MVTIVSRAIHPSHIPVVSLLILLLVDAVQPQQYENQQCGIINNSTTLSVNHLGEKNNEQCSLFIAPSTIPNAGLGIFTAQPLEPGDPIGYGEVMIPIIDADLNHRNLEMYWMIDDYTWDGGSTGMWRESERDDGVGAFGPGLDAAINCHSALINVGRKHAQWDEAGLHRSTDPGAGAVTQYDNAATFAKKPIPAGAELFKAYGDSWFETRPDRFAMLPLSKDFPKANKLLRRFHTKYISTNDGRNHSRLSDNILHSLYHLIATFPLRSRVLNAFPESFSDMLMAVKDGIESLHQPGAIRPIAELELTGRCLDNIRPGPSTLPQAGRGAFSTRFIPAGSVITGSPLFHIPTYEMLFMYDARWDDYMRDYNMDFTSVAGYQLLLNYCWGHPESTALFCPYGSGVNYMNHNRSLANVKVQWAPHGQIGHDDYWLRQTRVSDWIDVYTTKLAMDYVALRDISPGEELFLDYGSMWEDAWTQHVSLWDEYHDEMGISDRLYQSAAQYNQLYGNDTIRTVDEQRTDPYPSNLETRCHPQLLWYFDAYTSSGTHSYSSNKWIETKVEWSSTELGEPCHILERQWVINDVDDTGDFRYTVEIVDDDLDLGRTPVVARGVTRDFIIFANVPYSTDMHLPWAFRHAMIIPDDMFPDNLKNLKTKL